MKNFSKREWDIADLEHFGRTTEDFEQKYIRITDKGKIIGLLHYSFWGGVMEIKTVIVSHLRRHEGVGVMMLEKAEEIAKKHKVHKMHLITGKKWQAIKLYRKRGFKKSNNLLDHYLHKDFIEMVKKLSLSNNRK